VVKILERLEMAWLRIYPKLPLRMDFADPETAVVRKNSIRLPSDRDVGTYLFGFFALENPGSQLGWQKIPLSLTDPVPS